MDTTILFKEVQAGGKKPVADFFKITGAVILAVLAFHIIRLKGRIDESDTLLFIGSGLCLLIAIATGMRMVTQIRTDGVYVKFPPFQPGFSRFIWENIQDIEVRKFNALSEFNGWGIKYGLSGKGYVVAGDTGIQLILRDHSRVLISTHKAAEVIQVLRSLNRLR
ncbi:MAG TPA: hypothetical protein VNR87_15730 [Flavisolibacter sp.]|nr:hypothetical protein [Flavisolibacter sp.]